MNYGGVDSPILLTYLFTRRPLLQIGRGLRPAPVNVRDLFEELSARLPNLLPQATTMIERTQPPFWRGFRAAIMYYCASAIVFLLLKMIVPLHDHVYIFFIFLPAILLVGVLWAVESLVTSFFRKWPRGALIVHLIVLLPAWWIISPKPPVWPKAGPNPEMGELMPTFNSIVDQRKFMALYQKALESWSIPAEERNIGTRFGRTHIITFGIPEGRPLILLHQGFSNSTDWKYMSQFLKERYRVHAIDIIGEMGKSYAYDPPKTEKEVSQWFQQVLDTLGLDRVSICGHSNGGFQAMLIAQQIPDRVERLILLAPAAGFRNFSLKFYLASFGAAIFPRESTLEAFKNSASMKPGQRSEEINGMQALTFMVGANQLKVYPREFSDDELRAIKAPTLLILGKDEMIYSPEEAAGRASRLLPNCRVILLPDCGHEIPFDLPKEASSAIDSFMSEPDQDRSS